ncbi:hypothetical protein LEMLEM_LOCUS6066, partial [Lemmus lemmus]
MIDFFSASKGRHSQARPQTSHYIDGTIGKRETRGTRSSSQTQVIPEDPIFNW